MMHGQKNMKLMHFVNKITDSKKCPVLSIEQGNSNHYFLCMKDSMDFYDYSCLACELIFTWWFTSDKITSLNLNLNCHRWL